MAQLWERAERYGVPFGDEAVDMSADVNRRERGVSQALTEPKAKCILQARKDHLLIFGDRLEMVVVISWHGDYADAKRVETVPDSPPRAIGPRVGDVSAEYDHARPSACHCVSHKIEHSRIVKVSLQRSTAGFHGVEIGKNQDVARLLHLGRATPSSCSCGRPTRVLSTDSTHHVRHPPKVCGRVDEKAR